MNKFYTVKKKIKGKEYTAQFNGISNAVKMYDECRDASGNVSLQLLNDYVFENIIVEPKGLTADDFETMEELNAVVKFGQETAQGKFRDRKDAGSTAKAGKE